MNLDEHIARMAHGLSSPPRLRLLVHLQQRPASVSELAERIGASTASTSAHLDSLLGSGLVARRKEGRRAIYSLAPHVDGVVAALRLAGEHNVPAAREVLRGDAEDHPWMTTVGFGGLLGLLAEDEAVVLDVRDAEEHRAGHLPGARCLPMVALSAALPTLDPARPIYVYCRGPYCPNTRAAVELLRGSGYEAWGVRAGIGDWRAEGLEPAAVLEGEPS